jgi:hypothetical protein
MSASAELKEKKMQEKYKLKMLEIKEENKKTLCIVNLISTVATIGLALGTLAILNAEPKSCNASPLRFTLWLMLGMHATNIIESVCALTSLDRICCGCLCVIGFFIYEVGVLVYMQSIFYTAGECAMQTPTQYWWLLFNIIVYFIFFFISIYFNIKVFCSKVKKEEVEEELKKDEELEKRAHDETRGNTLH